MAGLRDVISRLTSRGGARGTGAPGGRRVGGAGAAGGGTRGKDEAIGRGVRKLLRRLR